MKSAFELALERSGGLLNQVPPEVKEKLAELETICKAKIAEAEISAQQRLDREEDPAKAEEVRQSLITEIASIRNKYEREKEKVRKDS